jgi:signal transduction histidine kinase/CheY-like chemotaxis protein
VERDGGGARSEVLEGQKRALELAIHGAPVADVLEVLVRAIERTSGEGMIASIQLVEGDRLRHGAAPGLPAEYNAMVDGHPIGPRQASCGTAAHRGEVVAVADIASDPLWADFREVARRFGLGACWSMPIRSPEGDIVGTFAQYYATPRDPAPRDLEAVDWIANTAGLVIARDLQARQKRRAEEALAAARDDLARQVAGLGLVHDLAMALHASSELDSTLELVLDVAIRVHGGGQGLLFLYRDNGLVISTSRGMEGIPPDLLRLVTEDVAAHDGQRYVIEDTEADPRYRELRELSRRAGSRAVHRTPIRTRSGKPLGVLSVHLATPRAPTDLEIHLADMCARYAADAIEWAHAVEESRLAREHAEQANRAKDEFLAILSHELRNPLAPIASAIQLIDVSAADERSRSARAVIERQLGHLTRLVDDLLDVTRIRQGRMEVQRAPLDVGDAIARAVEMSAPQLAQLGQTVTVRCPPGLMVEADLTRLAQVITNLLVNAGKYSDPGTTTTVSAHRVGDSIEITVRDQGIGLAPAMMHRIFELFAQDERSIERAHGGLGLGLAIVRKLVALHGGTVRADSDGPGRGSAFTIALPALVAQVPAPALRTSSLRSTRSRRILVADDNVDVADMLAELLGEMGHVVHTVHDGASALAAVSEFGPDVALLDIGLPDMEGLEVARELRQQPERCPYLVAVTGYSRDRDRDRAREAGFDSHLIKPVSIETLARLIDSAPVRAP